MNAHHKPRNQVMHSQKLTEPVRTLQLGESHIQLLPRQPYEVSYTPEQAIIGFAFEAQQGEHSFAASSNQPFATRPNSLAMVPKGCDVFSCSSHGGEYLRINVNSKTHSYLKGDPFNDHCDPRALRAAYHLRRMIISKEIVDTLELEQQLQQLLNAVRRHRNGIVTEMPIVENKLSSWLSRPKWTIVDDYIESSLDHKLTVTALAALFGVSSGFFSRAFKEAAGKAPHDYIVDRRLARARQRIYCSEEPLTDIALSVGFSSHAHMSAAFRKRLGISPSDLRI